MMPVKLYTFDGEFVAEVKIIPWNVLPELLFWGERVFIWRDPHKQFREARGTQVAV